MTALMDQPVDYERWQRESAEARTCPACKRDFIPNHPRRLYCGKPDCPGRKAPSGKKRPASETARRNRIRFAGVKSVLADVVMCWSADPPDGTPDELKDAVYGVVRAQGQGMTGRDQRVALIRLMTVAAVRILVVDPPPDPLPDPDDADVLAEPDVDLDEVPA